MGIGETGTLTTGLCRRQARDGGSTSPSAKPELFENCCCGMAGSVGYEAGHYEVSMQMAEAALLPAVRAKADAIVVADGTSCRHQIADGAQREAVHVARLLAGQLR